MKVLNLRCTHEHVFEGWFASEDDFADQQTRGLLECPVCADKVVSKLPSAPRLNLSHTTPQAVSAEAPLVSSSSAQEPSPVERQARMWRAMRELVERTEDVGARFAEEARRIHYGEADERGIRGQATREETQALLDEGIAVLPLPVPPDLKGTLH